MTSCSSRRLWRVDLRKSVWHWGWPPPGYPASFCSLYVSAGARCSPPPNERTESVTLHTCLEGISAQVGGCEA
jgi:hypothetical protein